MRQNKNNVINLNVAKRKTTRQINKQIVMSLIKEHQNLSRADLARLLEMRRSAVSLIVNELLEEGLIFESEMGGEGQRGRKPTFLQIDSRRRCVVAVDIRKTQTFLVATDLTGKHLTAVSYFPTLLEPEKFVVQLVNKIETLLAKELREYSCDGVGVIVPGMVDRTLHRVIHAPTLGWRNVALREMLMKQSGLQIEVENSGKACVLAEISANRQLAVQEDVVFISISDGVGCGVVTSGEVLRGRHNIAGEFGHVPLSIDGPPCSCGSNGCWETYISNIATIKRYFGHNCSFNEQKNFTVTDLIALARTGDVKALTAIEATARYLGLGLASVINAVDPARVVLGGELTGAWDLIETTVRTALSERTLTNDAAAISIEVVPSGDNPRLRGAVALVTAPAFAAAMVA
jgi:N-acetylglucosamine repressor